MKRKNRISNFAVCAAAIALILSLFTLTGCGSEDESVPDVKSFDISFSVNYPVKAELDDIENDTFKIEEKSTVLDVTEIYCSVNDIPLTIETTNGYVHGIDDVYNGDFYRNRQWRYKINGKLRADPPGEKYLEEGDTLEWVFMK